MDKEKIKAAIEAAEQDEKELLLELQFIKKRIWAYKQRLASLETSNNEQMNVSSYTMETDNNKYDPNGTWNEKIAYFFNREKRFLHNREVQIMLAEKEPEMDRKTLRKRVSSTLARLKKDGHLISITIGHSTHGVFWGTKEWLDEDGKPKKEHEYNEKYSVEDKSQRKLIF